MSEATIIATIRKNSREDVRVSLSDFKGSSYVDIRVHADYDGADSDRQPTRKGVMLAVGWLPELIAALQDAETEARRRGLIEGADT